MSALDTLLPASWRGVVFGVENYTNKVGRRTALHEYPYKDSVWIEDLGSGAKTFQFRGFLSGPLAAIQHDAMLLAIDQKGLGTLTHPTLGIFQGVITEFASHYSKEAGGVYELDISFTQSVEPVYPGAATDFASTISLGALNLFSLAGTGFGTAISVIGIASAAISALPSVVGGWMALPQQMLGDAQAIANSITGLDPSYGPYALGSTTQAAAGATPASLQQTADTARAAAVVACGTALAAAGTGVAATVAAAVQAVPTAVRAAMPEPADQIRALLTMAAFSPNNAASSSASGPAIGIPGFVTPAVGGSWALTSRSTAATYLDAAGLLQTAIAGQVRPLYANGVLSGILAEAAATNYSRNPRCEGATKGVMGSGGAAPTDMLVNPSAAGVTVTIIGTGYEDNIPFIDVQFAGTATAQIYLGVWGEVAGGGAPVSSGVAYTVSAYVKLTGGSLAGASSVTLFGVEYTTAGTYLLEHGSTAIPTAAALSGQRVSVTAAASASAASVRSSVQIVIPAGATVNCTLRVGGQQIELGSAATSLILPPVGSPGVTSRAADVISTIPASPAVTDSVALGIAQAQSAATALCLYCTLAELANAAVAYNFTSYNQASTIAAEVAAAFDQGILTAGNSGADDVCQALRLLRASVVQYLAQIGATLAPLRTVTFKAPLPALTIAQRLYQNGTRSDELIRNAVPWHPAFMPQSLTVPAS